MKSITKRIIIIISSVLLLCLIGYSLLMSYVIFGNWEGNGLLIDEEDKSYYSAIKEFAKDSETGDIDLKDVFEFDWDRAYITSNTDLTDDKKLCENIDTEEEYAIYEEMDGIKSIVFLKGDKVTYQYLYIIDNIHFMPEGEFITRENAVFEVVQKSHWYRNKMILQIKDSALIACSGCSTTKSNISESKNEMAESTNITKQDYNIKKMIKKKDSAGLFSACFAGEWKVTRRMALPRVYSESQVEREDALYIGETISIKPDVFINAWATYEKPVYEVGYDGLEYLIALKLDIDYRPFGKMKHVPILRTFVKGKEENFERFEFSDLVYIEPDTLLYNGFELKRVK